MAKILILSGDSYAEAFKMFERHGHTVVRTLPQADVVVFLGGTDVDPLLYGCERHPKTQHPDTRRDAFEKEMFLSCSRSGIPVVGICRGGQLLNVLNGGGMIQHIGYNSGVFTFSDHYDLILDHHQGMIAGQGCEVSISYEGDASEPFVVGWYPKTKSLCFQPHPEWGHQGTEDYFFSLLKEVYGGLLF